MRFPWKQHLFYSTNPNCTCRSHLSSAMLQSLSYLLYEAYPFRVTQSLRVCIIINGGMPWYDDVHHHLLIYDHTGPDLHARAFLPLIKSQSLGISLGGKYQTAAFMANTPSWPNWRKSWDVPDFFPRLTFSWLIC